MKTFKKEYIHYLIALIIGIVIAVALPASNGLTNYGVRVIAIMVPCLYLWLTTNTHWTSLMCLALLVCTQAVEGGPNAIWAGSMGHFVVITVMVYMLLNVCLTETGVINKIAMWFVSRKFIEGRPYAFMTMFFASNVIIGFFVDNLSLAIIYIGIAEVLLKNMGCEKGSPFYTTIMLGTLWGNCLLSICSPIAHALPNIIMGIAEAQVGVHITYAQWLAFGAIYAAIIFVVMMIIMRIWNPDTSAFVNYDVEKVREETPALSKNGKIASAIFIIVVAFVVIPQIFKSGAVLGYLNSLGVVIPAIFGVVALALIRSDGKPILDVPAAFRKVPWPPVIFAGTVSVLAVPLSSEATGISAWLGNVLRPVIGNMGPTMIVVVLVLLAILMTNFLSNTVTQVLFFSIGAILLANSNYSLAAFAVVIAIASGMATITPSASIVSPFYFAEKHLTMKPILAPNLIFVAACFVICAFIGVPLATAIIG